MRRLGYLLTGMIAGLLVGILAFCLAFPSIDPSIWREYAEATGCWPSAGVTPVLWRRLMFIGCTPEAVSSFAIGLLAFCVFDILWRTVCVIVPSQDGHRNWLRLTVPSVSLLGAALVVFSESVWRQALSGSPALLTLALFLLAIDLMLVSFCTETTFDDEGMPVVTERSSLGASASFLLSGALAVETPVAFLLPILFCALRILLYWQAVKVRSQDDSDDQLALAPIGIPNWLALFFWVVGFAFVCAVSDVPKDADGLQRYLVEVVRDVRTAAAPLGWMLWTAGRMLPLVMICGLLPVLMAKTDQRPFVLDVMSLVVGILSLTFASPVVRGDWMLVSAAEVHSPLMQSLGSVLSALAVAMTLFAFCRRVFHEMPRGSANRRLAVWCVGLALVAAVAVAFGGIGRSQARQLRRVIADAMEETVREAEGMTWIFTDGSSDVGIKLTARRHGQALSVMPLIMGGPLASTNDASTLLRDWVAENSTNLQASAVQLGFDLWRRERKPVPEASGLLARLSWPEGERERGIAVAERLGERMIELSRAGALKRESAPYVRGLFATVMWRLARMARQRGDMERADGLDEANVTRRQTMELIHRERMAAFGRLTDKESLQLALNRADFASARHFARNIIERTPDDVSANFALGMSCLMEKKTGDAVFYLEKAHQAKPKEPAIMNNLAIAYLRLNDLERAESWAKKALERAPDIPEIQETMRRIKSMLTGRGQD